MTPAAAALLAACAAGLAAAGALTLLSGAIARLIAGAGAAVAVMARGLDQVLAPLRRAGVEGRDATSFERRRLQVGVAAAAAFAVFAVGVLPAAALAIGAALLVPRALGWRRARYTRRLGEGTALAAARIADALAAGHTTRAAIGFTATELDGPIGRELARVATEIELGATMDAALWAFRARAGSRRVDLLVAAIRLQRRSGGNLASLLRDVAAALEDQSRLEAETRAETAQARFTSTVVLAMPFCLLALYELVAPGALGRVTGSALGAWLLGAAVAMQAIGAMVVRRLARVDA